MSDEIAAEHSVRAEALILDVSRRDAAGFIADAVAGRDVGLVVCNAGINPEGEFEELELEQHQRIVDVNVAAERVRAA